MGKTSIEWADVVWNPVTGCTKVSQGCKNCYAKSLHDMRHKAYMAGKKLPAQYAHPFETVQVHLDRLEIPLRWKRRPQRVFVNSMSDLFHEKVSLWFIARVFAYMALASEHTFMILTKRPHIMQGLLANRGWVAEIQLMVDSIADNAPTIKWPLPNVWLGVSVEDQRAADERIPLLLKTPAAVRFASCEPLLGPVRFEFRRADGLGVDALNGVLYDPETMLAIGRTERIDWIITGGESGPGARPMHPDWARSLREQCQGAGVPFFFKQWGEWKEVRTVDQDTVERYSKDMVAHPNGDLFFRVGKKAAGRRLDGREWNQFPGVE